MLRVDVTRGDKVVDVSKQDAEAQAWFQGGLRACARSCCNGFGASVCVGAGAPAGLPSVDAQQAHQSEARLHA